MNTSQPHPAAQYEKLIRALSERLGLELDITENPIVLADAQQQVRLLVKPAADDVNLHLICPFLEIGEPSEEGGPALRMLQLNSDRETLGDAVICVDAANQFYLLMRAMPLDTPAQDFLNAIDALQDLAQGILQDDGDDQAMAPNHGIPEEQAFSQRA